MKCRNVLIGSAVLFSSISLASTETSLFGIPEAHATTFNLIAPPGLQVSGSITTDGTTGSLSASDILSWQIVQNVDTVHFQGSIDQTNSQLTVTGAGLAATAAGLFFNFGDTDGSFVDFTTPNLALGSNNGGNSGLALQFCDAIAPCENQTGASLFSSYLLDLVAGGCCSTSGGSLESGIVEVGVAPTTAVPEPTSLTLIGPGLLMVGLLRWRRRRRRFPELDVRSGICS